MARSYGSINASIWRDEHFRGLSSSAQRLYLLLITQADISSAGTLPLTLRRWSAYAADTHAEGLSDALSELEKHRFIVLDGDAEELLVRKFVKWDGGYNNEKRRPAIQAAANAVTSPRIRRALAVELDTLGVPHDLRDSPSDSPPDGDADSPRVVVTEGEYRPQPTTLVPETEDDQPPAPAARSGPESLEQHTNRLARIYTDRVKLTNFSAIRGVVRTAIRADYSEDQLAAALSRMAADKRPVTADSLRIEIEGRPRSSRPPGPRSSGHFWEN